MDVAAWFGAEPRISFAMQAALGGAGTGRAALRAHTEALPPHTAIRLLRRGEGRKWAAVESAAGEFPNVEAALQLFQADFEGEHEAQTLRSCFVAEDTEAGEVVGTASAWPRSLAAEAGSAPEEGRSETPYFHVHWVGVRPSHQGRGLAKALVATVLLYILDQGQDAAYLLTSTASMRGIAMYRKVFGFRPRVRAAFARPDVRGWLAVERHLARALLTVEQAQANPVPGLFAYKTAPEYEGVAALDWFDPGPGCKELSAELWCKPLGKGWARAASFQTQGAACVLLVDAAAEKAAVGVVTMGNTGVEVCPATLPATGVRWTHLARIEPHRTAILAYAAGCGSCAVLTPARQSDGSFAVSADLAPGPACPSLSAIAAFTVDAEGATSPASGVASLRVVTLGMDGVVALHRGQAAGESLTECWSCPDGLGADGPRLLLPLRIANRRTCHAFVYSAATSAWRVAALDDSGGAGLGGEGAAAGTWRRGLGVGLPFHMGGCPHVLGYDVSTGEVEVLRLASDAGCGEGDGGEVVWRFKWSAGWDIQLPLV